MTVSNFIRNMGALGLFIDSTATGFVITRNGLVTDTWLVKPHELTIHERMAIVARHGGLV